MTRPELGSNRFSHLEPPIDVSTHTMYNRVPVPGDVGKRYGIRSELTGPRRRSIPPGMLIDMFLAPFKVTRRDAVLDEQAAGYKVLEEVDT